MTFVNYMKMKAIVPFSKDNIGKINLPEKGSGYLTYNRFFRSNSAP
jgi:hypothetical protein